ncbi:hypothetical protein CI665_027510 [Klebsiella quasipneumoniae subsp. similipneumoniae]|nr:hypothetical protein CU643_28425 [Klebsiella pneumoniae]AWT21906.1 hypothetical protein DMP75_27070 [Klebsiella michiganensis]EAA3621359.1 hypothetical protein [Salmonella enterica subsp. enterica]EAB5596369.1 hypothetical protein [Salmonella enterica subsp. enterica serovar Kentucky]EAM1906141.1 hypothetical protein [Salmonella enterica]EBG2427748.1 hypothetical protein [Salmonella enterica subsp. enterica serovar Enteritidis]ECA6427871.1 hypothetical protein [Salmonella enterica subsp. e
MALTGGNLFSTNVLIIVFCSFDNNHPYNPQVNTVGRHFCRDDGNQNMSLPGVTGMVGRICRNNRCKKTDW